MKYAAQIESFFMGKDAYSFVFESPDDKKIFSEEVMYYIYIYIYIYNLALVL